MTASIGSHCGSFGKGGPNFGESRHELAAQRRVVDLALDRARTQDFLFVRALLCGRLGGGLVAVDRIHGFTRVLPAAMCYRARPIARSAYPSPSRACGA